MKPVFDWTQFPSGRWKVMGTALGLGYSGSGHDFGGAPLRVIMAGFWSRPTAEIGTRTALTENGTEFHTLGPGLAQFWDFQDMLNFTLQVHVSGWSATELITEHSDSDKASSSEDGHRLSTGSADITHIYPFREGILKHFSYLHPVRSQSHYLFFKQPSSVELHRSIFMDPFDTQVWSSLLFICVTVVILLCVNDATVVGGDGDVDGEGKALGSRSRLSVLTLSNMSLWVLGTFTGQSYPHEKRTATTSLNLASLTASTFALVMLSLYTAAIVSSLSLQTSPIRKVPDLIEYGYETVGPPEHPDPHDFTLDTRLGNVMQIMNRKNFRSYADSVTKVLGSSSLDPHTRTPHYAAFEVLQGFWSNAKRLNYTTTQICDVSSIKSRTTFKSGMLIRKGSPLKEVLNVKILQSIESGLNRRYEAEFMGTVVAVCPVPELYANRPIQITDISQSFYFLVGGMMLGGLAWCVEWINGRMRR